MDYRLIFLSLGSIVISWGGVPSAIPNMAMKMPCLNRKTVRIGKSVLAFIRAMGNFPFGGESWMKSGDEKSVATRY